MSLLEVMVVIGILAVVMGLSLESFNTMTKVMVRDATQSSLTSTSRGAVDRVVLLLRNDFVQFNVVAGTPLGVNFDLDDAGGALVRDGMLFYVDVNHNALIFRGAEPGQPESAGLDDANGDGRADVVGLGLVRQDVNRDAVHDFVDADNNRQPDDVDRDGQPDRLWSLVQVRFNNVAEVSTPALWLNGRVLATNVYIARRVPGGTLTADNIRTFQFTANNPLAQAFDDPGFGGDGDGTVEENEIGNMQTPDGIINTAGEVASIDSISLRLNVAQAARQGLGRTSVETGSIDSDRITPRALMLIKRNGMVGLPDATRAANIR